MSGRADELAAAYDAARPRLVRVAYAVLGSGSDAEDVVSDVWLRLVVADGRDPVLDVEAWSTTVVARAALDVLRSARSRREVYVGPWLPEPLVALEPMSPDPADRVTLDESVSFALLVVLESLSPAERTSWVLHELFGVPFAEVARVVGRSPDAVRQLASRARAHLAERAPRLDVDAAEHDEAVGAFLRAAAGGDLEALVATLDPDVVLTSDGGGEVSAARRPVHGADSVARFFLGIAARRVPGDDVDVRPVNGRTGLVLRHGDELTGVVSFTVADGRVVRVDFLRSPSKLLRVARRSRPRAT